MSDFQRYQSRPITRLAHKITEDDIVTKGAEEGHYLLQTKAGHHYAFVAHQEIYDGDYVVYLNEDDIYHCSKEVFLERNIVPEDETNEEEAQ